MLTDIIDLPLVSAERERAAGPFSVDLVAEDDAGNPVVIENQLEKSNHDHLGKLITYSAVIEAKAAIWIVSDPRPEHVRAVAWLNQFSPVPFFLLKLEGIRIGDSPAAPLLTLIVGPSEESREVGETRKEIAERYVLREKFWTKLLDSAKGRTRLHAAISPGRYSFLGASDGKRGLGFNYVALQHEAGVELYIDRGRDSEEENMRIFHQLERAKDEVEKSFGEVLEWQPLEERRACCIRKRLPIGGWRNDESEWPTIQSTMVDAMIRLEASLKPFIQKLSI